jgi:hypothetical protein
MMDDNDPWTYQISAGLAPPPKPDPEAHDCPACGGPMSFSGGGSHPLSPMGWYGTCIVCRLELLRSEWGPG